MTTSTNWREVFSSLTCYKPKAPEEYASSDVWGKIFYEVPNSSHTNLKLTCKSFNKILSSPSYLALKPYGKIAMAISNEGAHYNTKVIKIEGKVTDIIPFNETTMIIGTWKSQFYKWDLINGNTNLLDLKIEWTPGEYKLSMDCRAMAVNGTTLYAGFENGVIHAYDLNTETLVSKCNNSGPVTKILIHNETLIASHGMYYIQQWDLDLGRSLKKFEFQDKPFPFPPDISIKNNHLYCLDRDISSCNKGHDQYRVFEWDLSLKDLNNKHTSSLNGFKILPKLIIVDGHLITALDSLTRLTQIPLNSLEKINYSDSQNSDSHLELSTLNIVDETLMMASMRNQILVGIYKGKKNNAPIKKITIPDIDRITKVQNTGNKLAFIAEPHTKALYETLIGYCDFN